MSFPRCQVKGRLPAQSAEKAFSFDTPQNGTGILPMHRQYPGFVYQEL
jgi:hypothetical protein